MQAVAPIARQHGIPVIAFSTDRSVAGNGVYLLSFQPENEVKRILAYAASQGHSNFAALVPLNPYGDHVADAVRADVTANSGQLTDLEHFNPQSGDVVDQAASISASHPDALLVAQGGSLLRGIAPTLAFDNLGGDQVQLLGTGVWDDPAILHEPALVGGWFAAPQPDADDVFLSRYQQLFGTKPQELTTLSYDAVALVALLSKSGEPFQHFTHGRADRSQRLYRRDRHLPLRCRWRLRTGTGDPVGGRGRLHGGEPGAGHLPACGLVISRPASPQVRRSRR